MEYIKITHGQESFDQFAPLLTADAAFVLLDPKAQAIVGFGCVSDEGQPVAACLAVVNEPEVEILSLYVLAGFRRQKIASELLQKIYWETFYETDAEYIIASYCLMDSEIQTAFKALFEYKGFRFDIYPEDYKLLEFTMNDLVPVGNVIPNIAVTFEDLGKIYNSHIAAKLFELEFISSAELPDSTDLRLSMGVCSEGKISAFIWVQKLKDKIYRIGAIYSANGDSKLIRPLVTQTIANASKILSTDDTIVVDVYSSSVQKLIEHLTGGLARPSEIFADAIMLV